MRLRNLMHLAGLRWAMVLLLVAAIVCLSAGQNDAKRMQELAAELKALALAWETTGISHMGQAASTMSVRVNRHHGGMEKLLADSRDSDAGAAAFAAMLQGPLDEYTQHYAPGKALSAEDVKSGPFRIGEEPGHGFTLRAHLLLEVMKIRASRGFARQTLLSLCNLASAESRRAEASFQSRNPELKKELENARASGGVRSQTVTRMAWSIEQYLLDLARTQPKYLNRPAADLVNQYGKWHADRVATGGGSELGLSDWCANETLKTARAVADAL